jgi:hypothetical protein
VNADHDDNDDLALFLQNEKRASVDSPQLLEEQRRSSSLPELLGLPRRASATVLMASTAEDSADILNQEFKSPVREARHSMGVAIEQQLFHRSSSSPGRQTVPAHKGSLSKRGRTPSSGSSYKVSSLVGREGTDL